MSNVRRLERKQLLVTDRQSLFLSHTQASMSLFSKFFGKPKEAPVEDVSPPGEQEALVPVPIPALGVLLLHLEKRKGSPLSEAEVMEARDKAACIMLPVSAKRAMDEKRGYEDINPENAWSEWQAFRAAGLPGDA